MFIEKFYLDATQTRLTNPAGPARTIAVQEHRRNQYNDEDTKFKENKQTKNGGRSKRKEKKIYEPPKPISGSKVCELFNLSGLAIFFP